MKKHGTYLGQIYKCSAFSLLWNNVVLLLLSTDECLSKVLKKAYSIKHVKFKP